jgi:hypothetical protein
MAEHAVPPELHRNHWYEKLGDGEPDQLPVVAVSVLFCCAVPEIVGSTLLTGALPAEAIAPVDADCEITPEGAEVLAAETSERIVLPTSAVTRV